MNTKIIYLIIVIFLLVLYMLNKRNVDNLYTMVSTGKTTIRLATALQTGNYHKIGTEIHKYQGEMDTKLNIELIRTKGSIDNISLLQNRQTDFIFVQEDVAKEYNHPDFQFVCALFDEVLTCITTRESNISQVTDLNNDRYKNPDMPNYNTRLEFTNTPNRDGIIDETKLIEHYYTDPQCFSVSEIRKRQLSCEPYNKNMLIETFGEAPQYKISLNMPGSGSYFNASIITIAMARKVVNKNIKDLITQNITDALKTDKDKVKNTILSLTTGIRKNISPILTKEIMDTIVNSVIDELKDIPNDLKNDIQDTITDNTLKQINNYNVVEMNTNKAVVSLDNNIDTQISVENNTQNSTQDLLSLPKSKLEQIEMFFVTTSHPTDAIVTLTEQKNVKFVDLDINLPYDASGIDITQYPELLRQFKERKDPVAHQKNVYKPVANKILPFVRAYKTRCLLLTRKDINTDIVYILIKSIFTNTLFLKDLPFARLLEPRHMMHSNVNIPVHPGSVKYFYEIGFYSDTEIPIPNVKSFKLI